MILWTFLIKVNVLLSCFYFLYCLFCKSEKLLVLNRVILFASIIFSFLIPTLPTIHLPFVSNESFSNLSLDYLTVGSNKAANAATGTAPSVSDSKGIATKMDVVFLFTIIYGIIAGLFLLRFIKRSYKVIRIIQRSQKRRSNDLIYCQPKNTCAPFSYFKYIVIDKKQLTDLAYGYIVKHEEAHCKQWHSIDLILIEVIHSLFWMNPLVILLKRDLKLNLEYLADNYVTSRDISVKAYQYTLLNMVTRKDEVVTSHFAQSNIKQRITMINRDSPRRGEWLKYSLVAPGFIVLCLSMQFFQSQVVEKSHLYDEMTGYYQYIGAKHVLIHIMNQNGKLVLEQSWNNETISFEQVRDLNFYNTSKKFPLKFIKSTDGRITQVLAFEKDIWNKIDDYKTAVKQEVTLPHESLNQLAGYYQYQGEDKYLKITAAQNKIVLNESWSGNDITLFPESSTLFFSKQGNFPLEFIRDEQGAIVKAIAFHKDMWHKLKSKPFIEKW